ncbi:MAG TPA: hypothetical protein VJV75_05950 [Candidatus Polarisedimenticolia bacterium]|nr:hypothetical protein [Candidatus Polarisedimenticolia bacterium]
MTKPLPAALALASFATLLYELALMRLFSVTLWYYFAFFVISLALLGGGAAAALLHVRRDWVAPRLGRLLPAFAFLHGITCALSPAIYLKSHLVVFGEGFDSLTFAAILVLFFVPFLLGGAVVAAILSFHPEQVAGLYLADLGGAGLGCLLIVPLLWRIPAPDLLAWIGLLPIAAGFLLERAFNRSRPSLAAFACLALTLAMAASSLAGWSPYRVTFSKIRDLDRGLEYVRWTPLARISVYRSPFWVDWGRRPFGWGMSTNFPGGDVDQRWIEQDECAGTPLTGFDGNLANLWYLKYDVTNVAYRYRSFPRVLIIGAGGGRDILAAKHAGSGQVTAVEINPATVDVVNRVFGDFSGRPYMLPGVEAVVGEARNYIARSRSSWDLIQISLIDSWAASVAGAYALAENNLYTVEAFTTYFDHLTDDGVLTVSRWYVPDAASETLRLVNLAADSLRRRGIEDPRDHIVVVGSNRIATVLASKRPFTSAELEGIGRTVDEMAFFGLWIPGSPPTDPRMASILSPASREDYLSGLPVDLSAPTDDRPFFFLNVPSILNPPRLSETAGLGYPSHPVGSLRMLFFLLVGAAIAWTILPLALARGGAVMLGRVLIGRPETWLYFAAIGMGFMLVEICLLQRYVLFLGHPTYASSVVMFSLLLSAGLGSAWTAHLSTRHPTAGLTPMILAVIILLIALQTWAVPRLLAAAMGWSIESRIVLAGALLAPLGLVMGMALPLGVHRLRQTGDEALLAYLWGINGVFSVLGSVLATIIAVWDGYSRGLLTGLAAYFVALGMAVWSARKGRIVPAV